MWSGWGGWGWERRTARSWGLVGYCKGFALTLTETGPPKGLQRSRDAVRLSPNASLWLLGGRGWTRPGLRVSR